MADFFESAGDGSTWDKISRGGLERIRSRRAPDVCVNPKPSTAPDGALCSHVL